jgi:hypothetical protein
MRFVAAFLLGLVLLTAGPALAQQGLPLTTVSSQVASAPLKLPAVVASGRSVASYGIVVALSSGASLTYSVEVTADPNPSSTGNWVAHDVLVAKTASAVSNIGYPITGIRLNVTTWASGTATMGVALWGEVP